MKKVIFTNKIFYYLLITYILLMLLYNIFVTVETRIIFGLLPITIQIILIVLILTRERYLKTVLIVWAGVFLAGGYGLHVIGDIIQGFGNNFTAFKLNFFLYYSVTFIIGVLIIDFTRRTVVLDSSSQNINEKDRHL